MLSVFCFSNYAELQFDASSTSECIKALDSLLSLMARYKTMRSCNDNDALKWHLRRPIMSTARIGFTAHWIRTEQR